MTGRFFAIRQRLLVPAALLLIAACAPPAPLHEKQDFVPQKEIEVVSLVREGLYYFSRSRFVDAEFRFRDALELIPDADNVRFNLAVALMNQGSFAAAEALFHEILGRDPHSPHYLSGLGRLYLSEGRYAEAQSLFARGLKFMLEDKEFQHAAPFARSLAVLHFKLGDESAALSYSDLALQLRPGADELYRHAKLAVAMGYHAKAQTVLSAARETKNDQRLLQVQALAALGREDFPQALRFTELALDQKKADFGLGPALELLRYSAERMAEAAGPAKEAAAEAEDKTEAADHSAQKKEPSRKRQTIAREEEDDSEDGEAEEEEEEEVNPLEAYFESKPLDTTLALFWPLSLLEFLEQEQERLAAEQEEE